MVLSETVNIPMILSFVSLTVNCPAIPLYAVDSLLAPYLRLERKSIRMAFLPTFVPMATHHQVTYGTKDVQQAGQGQG